MNNLIICTKSAPIPAIPGLNAYLVDGRPYFSKSEIVRSTRGTNKKVEALNDLLLPPAASSDLGGALNPLQPKGSGGFPQPLGGACFQPIQALVEREDRGLKETTLLPTEVFGIWIAHEVGSRSLAVKKKATEFLIVCAGVGATGLAQQALGLETNPAETAAQIAVCLPKPDLTVMAKPALSVKLALYKAIGLLPPGSTLKNLPRNDRELMGTRLMGKWLNDLLYDRLAPGASEEINRVRAKGPLKYGRFTPSKASTLTRSAGEKTEEIARAAVGAIASIQHLPATVDDINRIARGLDVAYPRYK